MVTKRSPLLTGLEAESRQRLVAAELGRRGLSSGDRLGVVCDGAADPQQLLCLYGAALRTGIIPVVVNPRLRPDQQAAQLAVADLAAVVDNDELVRISGSAERARPADLAPVPLGRPMLFTSGTTGEPKGVWTGVLDEQSAAALAADEQEMWHFDRGDRHLVCGSLYHSAPIRFALGTLLAGGSVVMLDGFEPDAVLAAIDRHRPTTTFASPVHLKRLIERDDADPRRWSSFRLVAHAGAPCPVDVKQTLLERLPSDSVWEFYGSTEGQFTACSPAEWMERPGTVGRARGSRRIVADEAGVLWCTAPSWARFEYWRDADKTRQAWRDDSFTVGDLGEVDGGGYVYLSGRRDDLIITGGVNVYPAQVEGVLRDLPGIDDVVVFPRADEEWGQRVCAVVVGDCDPEQLQREARRVLAGFQSPKEFHVVAEIPRQMLGKVRRSTLGTDLGLDPVKD